MTALQKTTLSITILGGFNWGLIGLFNFDLIGVIFGGSQTFLAKIIFSLIGISSMITALSTIIPTKHL